jgi:hypothetical protein
LINRTGVQLRFAYLNDAAADVGFAAGISRSATAGLGRDDEFADDRTSHSIGVARG